MRVEVWSGDGNTYLGTGEYIGDVTVYFINCDDNTLFSRECAEEKPEEVSEDKITTSEHNPKIILDNGAIVYGCQVWWEKIKV